MESYDVVIVGAGASGLASGWYLSNKGLKVVVFEQGEKLTIESIVPLEQGGELQKINTLNPNPNIRNLPADIGG